MKHCQLLGVARQIRRNSVRTLPSSLNGNFVSPLRIAEASSMGDALTSLSSTRKSPGFSFSSQVKVSSRNYHSSPNHAATTITPSLLWSLANPNWLPEIPKSTKMDVETLRKDTRRALYDLIIPFDPASSLAGKLLPSAIEQLSYLAIRSWWVETGLRIGNSARVSKVKNVNDTSQNGAGSMSLEQRQLEWWKSGVDAVIVDRAAASDSNPTDEFLSHPTYRLLHALQKDFGVRFTKCHFTDVLEARHQDLSTSQYATMSELEEHAIQTCGSLTQLVLESVGIYENGSDELGSLAHRIAKEVGACHGLTNALRTSIPVLSNTGRLIVPRDICEEFGVSSPRYLLSALGQGDAQCVSALRHAVKHIHDTASAHLFKARALRGELDAAFDAHAKQHELSPSESDTLRRTVLAALLPGITSETFLKRLAEHNYDLTDRNLRNVSSIEHAQCAYHLLQAANNGVY